jgi:hypothetical protein
MLDKTAPLPEDPEELRAFTARLLAEVRDYLEFRVWAGC